MNNGGYVSQAPEKLGPKVEELLRADLGLTSPVPFEIVEGEAKRRSAGTLLSDAATHLFGGKESLLMTVCFDLQQPRLVTLQVRLNRQGVGCHLGLLLYSTPLSKPVAGEVSLEPPKTFGSSKFVGDPAVAEKLNANKDLIKRSNKFARTEFANFHLTAPRLFQVKPENGAAVLVAATFPRSYAMGFKVSLDTKEFAELAGLIEAAVFDGAARSTAGRIKIAVRCALSW